MHRTPPRIVARPDATVVWPDLETVLTFDLEGRPVNWWRAGRLCKRSLASEVHERTRVAGRRVRRVLTTREALSEFERLLTDVGSLARSSDPEPRARLDIIQRWTPAELLEERARYDRAYRPVAILPPDAYLSIVVQLTAGCTWNRCTFCGFYQDRPFRAVTRGELGDHLGQVAALLGRGAALRRTLFLADGNALALSDDRLLEALEAARARFPGRPAAGFADVVTGARRPPEAWEALRRAGLRRVHVGMESGHDALLSWMDKPQNASSVTEFVHELKTAGLEVAPIVMAGAGGQRFAAEHLRDTAEVLAGLPLGAGDRVYLSPFVEHPGSEYARRAERDGVAPLSEGAVEEQLDELRRRVSRVHPRIPVARYDLAEFLY